MNERKKHPHNIVGKGGIPLLYKIPPFLEIQDVPTFHRSIGKTKYWITYVTNLYIIFTLKVS